MDEGLLNISPTGCGQLVKLLITLATHCIFGSNFAKIVLGISNKFNNNKQQQKCRPELFFLINPKKPCQNPPKNINFYMGQQNLTFYRQMKVCLSDKQTTVILLNGFKLGITDQFFWALFGPPSYFFN